MTAQAVADALRGHPFLEGVPAETIERITPHGRLVHFRAGSYIFHEGEPAAWFFLIVSGNVAIELFAPERGRLLVDSVGPGEVVGWSWLYSPYRWHFDAAAVTDVEAVALVGASMRAAFSDDHELGYVLTHRLGEVMSHRLRSARVRLLDLYGGAPHAG